MKHVLQWTLLCSLALVRPLWLAAEELPSPSPPQPSPADFTSLVEHPDTLVLTNTSDRPIIAWMVRTVTRSSQGYEAKSQQGTDAYRAAIFPHGEVQGTLEPGESVTIPKPRPWLREDHRGPGASVRHYVGLVVFEETEAYGDSDLIENLFERRRAFAREAVEALDALERDPDKIREMPMYRNVFSHFTDRGEALAEIRRRATEDYRLTVSYLRPQDLVVLENESEQKRGDQ